MTQERCIGSRHSWSRALCRAGAIVKPQEFYELVKRFSLEERVPSLIRFEGLQYLADLICVTGVQIDTRDLPDPSPLSVSRPEPPDDLEAEMAAIVAELSKSDGLGFDEPESSKPSGSVLKQFVSGIAHKLFEKNQFQFLFSPIQFQDQYYYLLSTWRIRPVRMPNVEWNLSGTTGSSSVIHRCGPDVLVFEDDNPICIAGDISMSFEISPKRHPKTIYPGTHEVDATAFIWLLNAVQNREFRFWINEERVNTRPNVRPKEDIWKRSNRMKLPD